MTALGDLVSVSAGMALVGRASGASPGPWRLSVVESGDIEDDRLRPRTGALRSIDVAQSAWSEKQLLRPFDLLVTARSRSVKVALVPANTTRTVASATLLVLRAADPASGLPHFLWYFLTSTRGRALVEGQVRQGVTIPTLSAAALRTVPVPLPSDVQLRRFPQLVDAAVAARDAALHAATLRDGTIRDAIIASLTPREERTGP